MVNTGVAGVRARHHLAMLRNVAALHPDAAVFLMGINDWNRHIVEHVSGQAPAPRRALASVRSARKRLALRNSLLGKALLALRRPAQRREADGFDFEAYYGGQRGSLERPVRHAFRPERVLPSYAAEFEEISAACRELTIPCVFVTQPTGYRATASEELKRSFWMTPPNQDYTLDFDSMVSIAALYNEHLRAFARKAGHPLCDAAEALAASPENFFDDCHFNTAGSRRMSEIVAGCLAEIVPKESTGSAPRADLTRARGPAASSR